LPHQIGAVRAATTAFARRDRRDGGIAVMAAAVRSRSAAGTSNVTMILFYSGSAIGRATSGHKTVPIRH